MISSKRSSDRYQQIGGILFVAAGWMALITTTAAFVGVLKLLF